MGSTILTSIIVAIMIFSLCCEARFSTPSAASLDAFEKWFFEVLKTESPKLTLGINAETNEVGVYATRTIKADEELLRVPFNMMLTAERILEITEISQVIEDFQLRELSQEEIIAAYIAYLKVCDPDVNPWRVWISTLPDRYNTILYFNNEEMKFFGGISFEGKAHKIRERARKSFEIISPLFKKETADFRCGVPFTYDNWRWALSTVRSRKIDAVNSERTMFPTVIPFYDMFNHVGNSDKYSWGYSADHKFFHTEAISNYNAGQEVFQFYGHLANWELLIDYGFIYDQNQYDSILVNTSLLGVDPEDELVDMKKHLLKPYHEKKADQLLIFKRDSLSKELLNAAQIINGGENDFIEGKLGPKAFDTDYFMSVWFQGVCSEKLRAFATTLQHDEGIMRASAYSAMSLKSQMAIKLRLAEKKLLTDALNFWKGYGQNLIDISKQHEKTEL